MALPELSLVSPGACCERHSISLVLRDQQIIRAGLWGLGFRVLSSNAHSLVLLCIICMQRSQAMFDSICYCTWRVALLIQIMNTRHKAIQALALITVIAACLLADVGKVLMAEFWLSIKELSVLCTVGLAATG